MAVTTDDAVVLRCLDYSETSQVVVFFGRDSGKIRAIAKGIKRSTKTRFASAVDMLDVGRLAYSTRSPRQAELAIVTEWKQTRVFSGLRERLDRFYAGQYAAEVIAGLTEDWDPHPAVHEGLVRLLAALCQHDAVLPLVVAFQRLLLEQVGSMPRFDGCAGCGRSIPERERVHFSSMEGGLVCRDCEGTHVEKRRLAANALPVLRGMRGTGPGVIGAFDTFHYHIAHLMGREPYVGPRLRQAVTSEDTG